MGEGGEKKKKASSLRGRVARSRQTYSRKSNPMPLIIGLVVLTVMGAGLYVFFGGEAPKKHTKAGSNAPAAGGNTSTTTSTQPARAPADSLFKLLYYARDDSKTNPDKALADLAAQESKYGGIPDFQVAKAMAVDKKIGRAQGNAAKKGLAEEKLRYLEKAQELLDSGKAWDEDPMKTKTANLGTSLEQCKLLVKKYSE